VLTVGLLLIAGLLLALWARTRPGYDPYGWLVWGHLTIHWKLDTNGAPSWKPLPFLFTVPYALAGHRALWLWMITSFAVSLSGLLFAARIAYRLTERLGERTAVAAATAGTRWLRPVRVAGWVAGGFAAAALFGIRDYAHFILSAQSDTMIVSLCLGAIDCHLYGRPRWAFALGVLAALGRPEVWPMLALYGIWAWRTIPSMRWLVAVGVALIPVFWFGIPGLTSKSWFTAGNIALKSPRALHQSKVYGTLDRFLDLHELPVQLAALLAIAIAILRRERTTLLLAAAGALWVIVEIAFVLHGWPGVPRYLFEAAGVMVVLAGAAIGRILIDLPRLSGRILPRVSPVPAAAAALAAVAAICVLLIPAARSRLRIERADLKHERLRAKWVNHLPGLIARLGGPRRLFACGQPTTIIGYQSLLAWDLGTNTGVLFWTPHLGKVDPRPVVLFQPTPHAWKVITIDVPPARRARCQSLNVVSRVI
jgi:hypothetical protein